MTITEWRRVRFNVMRLMLYNRMPKKQALAMLEVAWPLDEEIRCECGRRPPAQSESIVWFNTHGHQCEAVNKAGGYFSYWTKETA